MSQNNLRKDSKLWIKKDRTEYRVRDLDGVDNWDLLAEDYEYSITDTNLNKFNNNTVYIDHALDT